MKTWKAFITAVSCCALAVGYGLIGCGDEGDADHAVCQDNDGDGYGNPSSAACVKSALDCDDTDEDVYPNAPEICDRIDNQCPGDLIGHGIVDDDAVCLCSFVGGNFTFTIADVEDNCPGLDTETLFPPGAQVGPVELIGFQGLPSTIEIPFGPPIGAVSVSIFSGGDDIRLAGSESIEVTLPGIGDVTATVTGVFCPTMLPGQVLEVPAAFTLSIASPIACDVFIEANGAASGG